MESLGNNSEKRQPEYFFQLTKQPAKEARIDALTFAASQLGWYKIQTLLHPESNEAEIASDKQEADLWNNAIEGVTRGDWSDMKAALQDRARLSAASAAAREALHEQDPIVAGGIESERESQALTNLIISLGV